MQDITVQEFEKIRKYIKENFGISLNDEKRSLVYSRLRGVLQKKGIDNFTQYYDYLVADKSGEAGVEFIDKITTNHTFFMRETDHFDYLRDTVLPWAEKATAATKDLRLWCAGCSSGEEAYTLMMIVNDHFGDKGWNIEMLATDISTNVLDKAVRGVYKTESVTTLPKEWQMKYFKRVDADYSVADEKLKKNIVFRKFNLMEDRFPFKKPFQVIFCRNVMIYFDNDTRDHLVDKYFDNIQKDGYLFIGHSESLNHSSSKYKYIRPAVYQKA